MKYNYEILQKHTVFRTVTGSVAYGLAKENSDIDEKAIVILPMHKLFQLGANWETTTFHDPDVEFHSLKKAMNLMNKQNPTMMELLFVNDEFIVEETAIGKRLREQRHLFLSRNCYNSYGGYAKDQLIRIKKGLQLVSTEDQQNHLKSKLEHIMNQTNRKLQLSDYGKIKISRLYLDEKDKNNIDVTINLANIPINTLHHVVSELTHTIHSSNKPISRNTPLHKMTKHAMHLIRLLKMGIEVLESGELNVHREHDKDFLLSIRNGNYTWAELFSIAEELFNKLEHARDLSPLPEKTDAQKINQLYIELMSMKFGI